MANDTAGKHPYSAQERPKIRIYSEPPFRIVLAGFRVTNAGYVARLEDELTARYRVVRKGEDNRCFPKSYRMPGCVIVQDTRNGHEDLAVIKFGTVFTEIVNAGKGGSRGCVEFLIETKSLLDGLYMSSGTPEDEIKTALKAACGELFAQ